MKLIRNYANKLVAGSVALLVLAWATELSAATGKQGSGQGTATVTAVEGQVRYSTDNSRTWHPVKAGLVLKAPAVIQTAASSHVDIAMFEHGAAAAPAIVNYVAYKPSTGNPGTGNPSSREAVNLVRITPNSILAIDKLTSVNTGTDVVTETQLDLRAGRIMGNVKKMSAASRYEVKFPTGVAGIRGTKYVIDASGVLRVVEGALVISYIDKKGDLQTKPVPAGYMFDPSVGGEPTPIPDLATWLAEIDAIGGIEALGGVTTESPSFYEYDHTLYFISPTTGGGGSVD